MVLMIFRPQGLFPVRQKLLTYGQVAARSKLLRRRRRFERPAASSRRERGSDSGDRAGGPMIDEP